MPAKRLILSALCTVLLSAPAAAQEFELSVERGLVTVRANDARLDDLLRRWSEITGLAVVSKGDISGIRLTLELSSVPERQALDLILRGVAGYVIGELRDPSTGLGAIATLIVVGQGTTPGQVAPTFLRQPGPSGQIGREPELVDGGEDAVVLQAVDHPEPAEPGFTQAADQSGVANPEVAMPGVATSGAQATPSATKPFGNAATAERPGTIVAVPESVSPPMSSEEILRRSQSPTGVPQIVGTGAQSPTP